VLLTSIDPPGRLSGLQMTGQHEAAELDLGRGEPAVEHDAADDFISGHLGRDELLNAAR
jgi:hypothetical protein